MNLSHPATLRRDADAINVYTSFKLAVQQPLNTWGCICEVYLGTTSPRLILCHKVPNTVCTGTSRLLGI